MTTVTSLRNELDELKATVNARYEEQIRQMHELNEQIRQQNVKCRVISFHLEGLAALLTI